jgi:Ran GTPase-activating protein 1
LNKGVLQILDMSDIIAGRPEEEALAVMLTICEAVDTEELVELNVSDNAIGFKGVDSIHSVISTAKKIERLFLCNNGMSAEAAQLVADCLLRGGCPPLTLLHFYNNMSGNAGAAAIASIVSACPALTDFRFSATRASSAGCISIASAVGKLTALTRLDLSDNSFSAEAAVLLAAALTKNTGSVTQSPQQP